MSELYFKKQLELDRPNYAKIGDTVHSILTEAQFQAERDTTWVLMDGRNIAGSDLAKVTGITNLPDARGLFLRAKNNGRADGNENPDGDLALGTYQADAFQDHKHVSTYDYFDTGSGVSRNQGSGAATVFRNSRVSYAKDSGGNWRTSLNETRPKSITVNIFIKINR